MKRLVIILILVLTYSCGKQKVQLAETSLNNITEILDVSPAYMFYNEETGDIEFNRKNLIGTTNWLINIDKRLTLEQVLPHLNYLQDKRNKAGMHKNEAAKNYLTCFNPDTKKLSFIDFTDIKLITSYIYDAPIDFSEIMHHSSVKIRSLENIEIETKTQEHNVTKKFISLSSTLDELKALSQSGNTSITLVFNHQLSYGDYINTKSAFISLESNNLEVLNTEIIYN